MLKRCGLFRSVVEVHVAFRFTPNITELRGMALACVRIIELNCSLAAGPYSKLPPTNI